MTRIKLNSIEAAKLEAAGLGRFYAKGRAVVFDTATAPVQRYEWHCRTNREALDTLRLFRRAPVAR